MSEEMDDIQIVDFSQTAKTKKKGKKKGQKKSKTGKSINLSREYFFLYKMLNLYYSRGC
jgi:hypothetical protein